MAADGIVKTILPAVPLGMAIEEANVLAVIVHVEIEAGEVCAHRRAPDIS